MAKNNEKKIDKIYYVASIISTVILFCAVLAYLFGFISISERVFILFIFTFGFELGIRISKLLGV